jgi:NADH-quinone oxidoreductase subunit N
MHLLLSIAQLVPVPLRGLFPEILLSVAFLLGCVLEWGTDLRGKRLVVWFAAISTLSALLLAFFSAAPLRQESGASFSPDVITQFVRVAVLSLATLVLLALNGSKALDGREEQGEAALLVLSVALGACLFASARHLVALYLGLEFLSLSSYGLAGFRARDARASEAGLKYVLYGGVASAVALFGISHLWGIAGSFDAGEVGLALWNAPTAAAIPVLLVAVAFAYKLGMAPFHFWSPDVYQGCPTVPAGFLSTVPKIAAFGAFLHVVPHLVPSGALRLQPVQVGSFLALVGAFSIAVGSATALVQKDAKRILAFSSTTNAGFMVLSFSTWLTYEGIAALGLMLLAYAAANLGAFLALDRLERDAGSTSLSDLAGSWKRNPAAVAALVICLSSLAGIPPLAGFAGKWAILAEVVRGSLDDGYGPALLVGVVAALAGSVAIAAAYLRIVRATVADDPASDPKVDGFRPAALSELPYVLCALGSVALAFGWPLLSWFRSRLGG